MRHRGVIGTLLLICVGVILGTTIFRDDIASATGLAGGGVTVSNTSANPVPVREQNLDGSNIRVHEEGTATVGLSSSANTVKIDATNPVPVVNANDGQNLYRSEASCTFPTSVTVGCGTTNAAIPDGKLLVVETVSAKAVVPDGDHITDLHLGLIGGGNIYLAPVEISSIGAANDYYEVTQQVRGYGDSPTTGCSLTTAEHAQGATLNCTIMGYLVNAS